MTLVSVRRVQEGCAALCRVLTEVTGCDRATIIEHLKLRLESQIMEDRRAGKTASLLGVAGACWPLAGGTSQMLHVSGRGPRRP